jgi:hypothetical protein
VGSYKVKSPIKAGNPDGRGHLVSKELKAGDSVNLSEQEAWDVRHALENPPKQAPGSDASTAKALESIRNNPENPESGVELFWKTQPDAFIRTEANKTPAEKAAEPKRQKALAETKAAAVKKAPERIVAPPAAPVVPPTTRPAPAATTKK